MSWAKSNDTLPQYRSVSWAAILAMMLGLASALAIFNPLLVAVAIVGTGLSLFALWQIRAQPEVLSGGRLALAALFLSTFFMVYSPARLVLRSWVLHERGQELADAFLSLLKEGKTYEAHQLSNLRHPNLDEPPDPTADPDKLTMDDFRGFEKTAEVQMIKRVENKFSFQLEGVEASRNYEAMETFVYRYRLVPDPSTGKKSFPLWVAVGRTDDPGTKIWKIVGVRLTFKEGER